MSKEKYKFLIILIALMSFVDMCLTAFWLRTNVAVEANPVMRYYWNFGIVPFIVVKSLMVFGGCYLIWRYLDRWTSKIYVLIAFVVYVWVMVIHFSYILGVSS